MNKLAKGSYQLVSGLFYVGMLIAYMITSSLLLLQIAVWTMFVTQLMENGIDVFLFFRKKNRDKFSWAAWIKKNHTRIILFLMTVGFIAYFLFNSWALMYVAMACWVITALVEIVPTIPVFFKWIVRVVRQDYAAKMESKKVS